jgi:lipopolysaccharide biosynthesis protein
MARLLAIHLPQFHPIPENDAWWGKGFTEWLNVVRARPQFPGHYQPHLPADLGFYDLRSPETREAQAELARTHVISGFFYYHYWFNGKLLLERPVREILESGRPDFPFCLCWANETWNRTWSGNEKEVLIGQKYSPEDDLAHIRWLLPYLKDPRYIRVSDKPVLFLYKASSLPDPICTARVWQAAARAAGLPGLYLVRFESNFVAETGDPARIGFDAAADFQPRSLGAKPLWWIRGPLRRYLTHGIFRYEDLISVAAARPAPPYKRYPCVMPGWDNTARRSEGARIWTGSTPELYERWLEDTLRQFRPFGPDEDFVLVNAWNEWAEGNHLEPDQKWGRAYLEATQRAVLATQPEKNE